MAKKKKTKKSKTRNSKKFVSKKTNPLRKVPLLVPTVNPVLKPDHLELPLGENRKELFWMVVFALVSLVGILLLKKYNIDLSYITNLFKS